TGVVESTPQRAGDRVVDVGVGEDDHRVFASELEHGTLELASARLADAAADLDRAGEEHLAHARLDECRAGARTMDDADEPRGQRAPLERADDPLADEGRERGGLEDDAIARHER